MLPVMGILLIGIATGIGQTVLFTEDFESGAPSASWALYREGEEPIQAVDMSSAPLPLTNGGNYVGLIQDADASYVGASTALAGTVNDSNYTIEGDVYVYTYHPSGSAYTGLAFYADSSAGTFYKLVADFDANNRFRLYNNRTDSLGNYTFHQPFDASAVDTAEGWHHMKIVVENQDGGYPGFTCYYDGAMLGDGAYIDSSDNRLTSGQWGIYAFQFAFSGGGIPGYFDNIEVTANPQIPISIAPGKELLATTPVGFSLLQNHPNPFNPSTDIEFTMFEGKQVTLTVYDNSGRYVRTLMDGFLTPRNYSFVWDGRDMTGRMVPSGVYLYRLADGTQHETRRMVLLK
jgi:hypothetical protein